MKGSPYGLFVLLCLVAPLVGWHPGQVEAAAAPTARAFSFVYETTIGPIPAGEGPIDVFVPIADSGAHQDVLSYEVESSIEGAERVEGTYGNRFWHGHVEESDGKPITVKVTYEVRRDVVTNGRLAEVEPQSLSAVERREHELFLKPNRLVPISGEPIDSILGEIVPEEASLPRIARATYDYVVDNMTYKKVGSGWGNGDTFWACSEKYGNCTDFHALFTSLARARGIPARFEIGFPVPEDRPSGRIGGYHCWVQFYLPDIGWVPIDASEAQKHPDRRELYYGTHPADRIRFSVGRDLELGEGHRTGPLNYFVYPHVEVDGRFFGEIDNRFAFATLESDGSMSAR